MPNNTVNATKRSTTTNKSSPNHHQMEHVHVHRDQSNRKLQQRHNDVVRLFDVVLTVVVFLSLLKTKLDIKDTCPNNA